MNDGLADENINKFLKIDDLRIDLKVASIINKETAVKYNVFPYKVEDNILYLVMEEVKNYKTIKTLKMITGKEILPIKASKTEIRLLIEKVYNTIEVERTINKYLEKNKDQNKINDNSLDKQSTPATQLFDFIIKEAINKNSSDIHFEPFKNYINVRYRIDGILFTATNSIPNKVYESIVLIIKILSKMDISQKYTPQDGKMEYKVFNKLYQFRISSLPTLYGEKIVIRLFYEDNFKTNLDSLYPIKNQREKIRKLIKSKQGMILITGPTGSGKTTTLYALLREIDKTKNNIVTIEDPVETGIDGINQINVNKKAGITFSTGLRSILRQDPDVIMIGEIRDEETAEIAVRASITGHLVLSTLHTNDAVSTISRLEDMGVPKYLLLDSLNAVISQRLVRKICADCRSSYIYKNEENNELGIAKDTILYKGMGCSKCNNTGYKQRTAAVEIFELNLKDKGKYSLSSIYDIRKTLEYDKNTMKDNSVKLILDGITTMEEIMRRV